MHALAFQRGQTVMISPHISGSGAGRVGYISGNLRDGHMEVLDRHPNSANALTIGWYESSDLSHHRSPRQGGSRR